MRSEVKPIPPDVLHLVARELGILEPQDPWMRCLARARVVHAWVEKSRERFAKALEELEAASLRALEAREELLSRCEVAEVTLTEIARVADVARPLSAWARHSEGLEEDDHG